LPRTTRNHAWVDEDDGDGGGGDEKVEASEQVLGRGCV
jgi:hypothetical protein